MQGKLARVALLDARSSIFFNNIETHLHLQSGVSMPHAVKAWIIPSGYVCHKRVSTKIFCKGLDKEDARL